jgi:hypothetical protein
MFFALDIDELKGLFGSKNEEVLNQILQSQEADIDAYIDTLQKTKQLGKGLVSFCH